MLLVSRVLCSASSALRGPRSSDDSKIFTQAACLLFRREALDALAKPTESLGRLLARLAGALTLEPFERPDVLQVFWRRWRIDVLRWRWRIDRLLVHGRASRLDSRLPPAGEEFVVDDAWCQKRRETGCEAEEEIQVGMVPTHAQLPLELAPARPPSRQPFIAASSRRQLRLLPWCRRS
jgi:hypothetical protein